MLPKATVKLQPTAQMSRGQTSALAAPALRAEEPEDAFEERNPEAGLVPLSILCLVLALILAVVNLPYTKTYSTQYGPPESRSFSEQISATLMPAESPPEPWELPGKSFNQVLHEHGSSK
jgi:hypothetical protein